MRRHRSEILTRLAEDGGDGGKNQYTYDINDMKSFAVAIVGLYNAVVGLFGIVGFSKGSQILSAIPKNLECRISQREGDDLTVGRNRDCRVPRTSQGPCRRFSLRRERWGSKNQAPRCSMGLGKPAPRI